MDRFFFKKGEEDILIKVNTNEELVTHYRKIQCTFPWVLPENGKSGL